MDFVSQQPKKSHSKSISVVSTTSRESVDRNELHSINRLGRKFGTGRNVGVELDPQPTDSLEDPLNWPQWKKEVGFGSLLLGVAVIGGIKTMLVTVTSVLKSELGISYMGVTALTGLPLILGAFSGLQSVVLSQMIGKRIIYLTSAVVLLLSGLWTMHISGSYTQFMISRILQGLSWGSFEALVLLSIKDTYFVHERQTRITIYNVVNIMFTWGSPILGGFVSQRNDGFRNQIRIVNIIQAFSILLLILVTPETTFKRDNTSSQSIIAPSYETSITTTSPVSTSSVKAYLASLSPTNSNAISKFNLSRSLLPIRALCAPTVVLKFLLTAPLVATAFGTAYILSLLFAPAPIIALPTQIGLMFTGPLVGSLIAYAVVTITSHIRISSTSRLLIKRQNNLGVAISGIILGFIGVLAFGFYVEETLRPVEAQDKTSFTFYVQGKGFNENIVTLLFGLIVSGSILLGFSSTAPIRSIAYSSSESDVLEGASNTLQGFLTGMFVIGMPLWAQGSEGMLLAFKDTVIGLGVVQLVISSTAAAVLWVKGETLEKLDGKILRRMPKSEEFVLQKSTGGFLHV